MLVFEIIRTAGWLLGSILYGVLFAVLAEGWRESSSTGLAHPESIEGRGTPLAYVALAGTALLWNLGNLLVVFLGELTGDRIPKITSLASALAVVGFGMVPSILIHAAAVARRGAFGHPRAVIALAYLPALGVVPAAYWALRLRPKQFHEAFRQMPVIAGAVGAWLIVSLVIAGRAMRRPSLAETPDAGLDGAARAQHGDDPAAATSTRGRFGRAFGVGLIVLGVAFAATWAMELAAPTGRSVVGEVALVFVMLLSLLPGGVVLYYVYRHHYMDLRIRRGLAFAAVIVAAFLAHALLIRPLTDRLEEAHDVNFALLEGLLVVAVVLLFEPVRRRLQVAVDAALAPEGARRREKLAALRAEIASLAPGDLRPIVARTRAALEEAFGGPAVVVLDTPGVESQGREETLHSAPTQSFRVVSDLIEWSARAPDEPTGRESLPDPLARAAGRLGLGHLVPVRAEGEGNEGKSTGAADGSPSDGKSAPRGLGFIGLSELPSGGVLGEEDASALEAVGRALAAAAKGAAVVRKLLSLEQKLAEAEKLSSLGRLSATIAHEVKNPLSSIKTIVTVLKKELAGNEQATRDLDVVAREVGRLSEVVTNLLSIARPSRKPGEGTSLIPPPAGFDAREMREGLLAVLGPDARRRGVELVTEFAPDTPRVRARESRVRQAVFQLLLNAIEVTPERGEVRLSTGPAAVSADGKAGDGKAGDESRTRIIVEDTGPGLPADRPERVFDEFFTTKPGGTGLGLAIAKEEIERAGGTIEAGPRLDDNEGARFVVTLPAAKRASPT
ncbi:MAG: sensor histidine kinase [Planctomycetota bacterium]